MLRSIRSAQLKEVINCIIMKGNLSGLQQEYYSGGVGLCVFMFVGVKEIKIA